MRLVIAGGGTGGHLFPGLAVARAAKEAGERVLFISSGRALETGLLKEAGLPTARLSPRAFLGRGLGGKFLAILTLARETTKAIAILRSFKAQVVLGLGGYTSLPVILAARILRIPAAVHEQNAVPGLANRLAARVANKILVSFEVSRRHFPASKVVVTGNPVRLELQRPRTREIPHPCLLVLGGSQGAQRLNQILPETVARLKKTWPNLTVIHQSGTGQEESLRATYNRWGVPEAMVYPFISDMAWAYAQADLVISRAGATTSAELSCLGKPAILVPYPYAGGHQRENARAFAEIGGALMMEERELTPASLARVIEGLLKDSRRLEIMAQRARELRLWGDPGQILQELENLLSDTEEAACTRDSISTL